MLAGLRCSDAFFSYRTVPVCASIKRTDGEASPKVRCYLRCCLLRLFCFLFRCFVLLLVGRFSILLCRSHFQRALQEAPGSSAGSRRYFVFFSSYSPKHLLFLPYRLCRRPQNYAVCSVYSSGARNFSAPRSARTAKFFFRQ